MCDSHLLSLLMLGSQDGVQLTLQNSDQCVYFCTSSASAGGCSTYMEVAGPPVTRASPQGVSPDRHWARVQGAAGGCAAVCASAAGERRRA